MATITSTNNSSNRLAVTKLVSNEASVVFTGLVDIVLYQLIVTNYTPVTAGSNLLFRCSTNNGSTFDAGSFYPWGKNQTLQSGASTNTPTGSAADTAIHVADNCSAGGFITLTINIHGAGASSYYPAIDWTGWLNQNGGNFYSVIGAGIYTPVVAPTVNAIQLIPSSGNISTGTFTLISVVI